MPKYKPFNEKSEATKSNYIQEFTPKHEEIMRRKLAGETNKDIAEAIGLTEGRISFITTSPIFQKKMETKQISINKRFEEELALDPVKRKFHQHSEEAADVIIGVMKGEKVSPKTKRDAANDVLGYDGYTQKPQEDHSTKIFIDASMTNDIKVALQALSIDIDLLKEAGMEGVVKQIESASTDKSESVCRTGKEEFLDILQGDTEK